MDDSQDADSKIVRVQVIDMLISVFDAFWEHPQCRDDIKAAFQERVQLDTVLLMFSSSLYTLLMAFLLGYLIANMNECQLFPVFALTAMKDYFPFDHRLSAVETVPQTNPCQRISSFFPSFSSCLIAITSSFGAHVICESDEHDGVVPQI